MKNPLFFALLFFAFFDFTPKGTNTIYYVNKHSRYVYEDRNKREVLDADFLSAGTIKFKLLVIKKNTKENYFIQGVARVDPKVEDPEIDGDEQGQAYAVDEFIFGKECGLTLRIDSENNLFAKVYESDCLKDKYFAKHKVSFDCRKTMHVIK